MYTVTKAYSEKQKSPLYMMILHGNGYNPGDIFHLDTLWLFNIAMEHP